MDHMHYFGTDEDTPAKQAQVLQNLLGDLHRTVQILNVDICTEEERVRVFAKSDPAYPVLARSLTTRRDNLNRTIALLAKRLHKITMADAPAA